jgi:hypothetical protein
MIPSCYDYFTALVFLCAAFRLRQSLQRRLAASVATICDDVTIVVSHWKVISDCCSWNSSAVTIDCRSSDRSSVRRVRDEDEAIVGIELERIAR